MSKYGLVWHVFVVCIFHSGFALNDLSRMHARISKIVITKRRITLQERLDLHVNDMLLLSYTEYF